MIDEELNQGEFTPPADPAPVPETDPVPAPTPEPAPTPAPGPAPSAPPMEVISVEELIDRLITGDGETDETPDEAPEESQEPDEPPPGGPGDTVAFELAPDTLAILDAMDSVQDELDQLSGQLTEIQQHLSRPALTTPFADYTIPETLLLLLLLAAFAAVCARMLKGGLKWLRS